MAADLDTKMRKLSIAPLRVFKATSPVVALTALTLFALFLASPSLAFSAEQLTKQEIDEIAKSIGSDVKGWTSNVEDNMQKPLQGDKLLTTIEGQTIDASLDCAKTSTTELIKATAKRDGATGRYALTIRTNIEGKTSTFSETISGLCPDNGYVVCSKGWFSGDSCKAYAFGLSNTKIVSLSKDPKDNDPIPTTGCLCLDNGCGGSAGVSQVAVAQEIASVTRSLIGKAYPHLTVTKEQQLSNDSYAYYISQEPTCGSKAIVALPSDNLNQLNEQARALRTEELENNESVYSLTLAMDKGKEEARLNEDYQQIYEDLRTRTDKGLKTVDVKENEVTYTDIRLNDNGEWVEYEGSIELANLEQPTDQKSCVIAFSRAANSEVLSDGSTTGGTASGLTEIVRETRLCDDNGKCPVKSGETIVSSCSFSSGNQGQVLATLAGLDEIKDDLKCNGKEPNEANCNLGNITIFNGEARKCGDYVPKYCGSNICKCCDDSKAFWGMGHCSSSSKQLGQDKADGKCAQVGTWTEKKKLLFVRVDYKKWKGYCCYKSKLARIIQEQGRPQIKAYYYNNPSRGDPSSMDWGSAKNPNCRGFTSVEFQVLDFSKIDLSEFFGDMNIDPQRINDQLDELDKHQDNAGWRDNMEDKANDKEQQERMKDAEEVREGM